MRPIIILFVLATIVSCDDSNPTFTIEAELSDYVNSFYQEAQLRGKTLPQDNLIAQLDSNCQGMIEAHKDNDQWILKLDREIFTSMEQHGNPNNKIESMIFHELGRIILKRDLSKAYSIMNGDVKINGYPTSDRQQLLDELFQ